MSPRVAKALIEEARGLNLVHSAFEKVRDKLGWFEKYRVFSPHVLDIWILMASALFIFISAAIVILLTTTLGAKVPVGAAQGGLQTAASSSTLQIIFGTAVFGGLVTLLARFIETAQKRLGTVDLFVGEILSIGRVFVATRIVPSFIELYMDPKLLPTGFADVSRSENYTLVFEKNSSDLGGLASRVIINVTSFYSFLKASRDATQSMKLWGHQDYSDDKKRDDVLTVIFNCLLMAIHGRLALDGLMPQRGEPGGSAYAESNAQLFYARALFHTIELQCFLSLLAALPPDDVRRATLMDRVDVYEAVMKLPNYGLGSVRELLSKSSESAAETTSGTD